MEESGQVYFASDKEVSQEDALRYKEAEMEIERARAEFAAFAERAERAEAEALEREKEEAARGAQGPPTQ